MGFGDLFGKSKKSENVYEEDLVAKFASLSESFYEFIDIEYGDELEISSDECRKILEKAMADLGHPDLDMDKLNKSHSHYLIEGNLEGNPNYNIETPDFSKYF